MKDKTTRTCTRKNKRMCFVYVAPYLDIAQLYAAVLEREVELLSTTAASRGATTARWSHELLQLRFDERAGNEAHAAFCSQAET